MQVLHQGGIRGQDAASDASAPLPPPPSPSPSPSLTPGLGQLVDASDAIVVDDELEIRASHITAAAVAAAAVTAAVATTLAADDTAAALASSASSAATAVAATPSTAPAAASAAQSIPMPARQTQAVRRAVLPSVRAVLVSLLTLACIGVALWWSSQWPLPQRALQPIVPAVSLPGLHPAAPTAEALPVLSSPVAPADSQPEALSAEDIAQWQDEAQDKARQLAARRAQTQARNEREDAALAQREKRRRQAQAQLDEARERAERAQANVPAVVAPRSETPAQPSLAEQLQQCNALSLFARERCLWKLCDGKWGQGACPSYQHPAEGA